MNDNTGTEANLLRQFPLALQWDERMQVMAQVIAKALALRWQEARAGILYPDIDSLPEELLDILAYDFKVDWWDRNYSLAEKRRVFKDSWYVHKHMGTKAAVETAVRAIYPLTTVEEWFEYEGGKPYHFRLHIDLTGEKPVEGKLERMVERIGFYKNLRSHVDSIRYTIRLPEFSLSIGGGMGAQVLMSVPVEPDTYSFEDTLHAGGVFAERMVMPVPEDVSQPPATTIRRAGNICTIISNLSGED